MPIIYQIKMIRFWCMALQCASATCEHFIFQGECKPDEAASEPSVSKEELYVLAARIRIQLALQHLQHYLTTPSHPRLPKITQTPRLHVAAQRLLAVAANVTMSESDKAFIHRCLRDCVWCINNKVYCDTVTDALQSHKGIQVIFYRACEIKILTSNIEGRIFLSFT